MKKISLLFSIIFLVACSSTLPPVSGQSNPSPSPLTSPTTAVFPIITPSISPTSFPSLTNTSIISNDKVRLTLWTEWKQDRVDYAAWSPDSSKVVFTKGWPAQPKIFLYDIVSGEKLWEIDDSTNNIIFSHDGKFIVTSDVSLRLFDTTTGRLTDTIIDGGNTFLYSAFLSDNSNLIIGGTVGYGKEDFSTDFSLFDKQQKDIKVLFTQKGQITSFGGVSPDGKLLAVALGNVINTDALKSGQIFLWDLATKSKRCSLPGDYVVFNPIGRTIATTDSVNIPELFGKIVMYDTATCKIQKTINTINWISSMAFSPDGRLLAIGGEPDGMFQILDAEGGKIHYQQDGLGEIIEQLVFSPDGNFLLSVSGNGKNGYAVQIWKLR
jgi:WD40 repeat protein